MTNFFHIGRLLAVAATVALIVFPLLAEAQQSSTKYVCYQHQGATNYGILDGQTVRELAGSIFESPRETGKTLSLSDVKLLIPTEPSKILAVGMNYASHLSSDSDAPPPLFAKFPSSLIAHGDPLVIPQDAGDPHYEGELVIVIGKKAKNVSKAEAHKYIFGVTAGNDVSERSWQGSDLQWLRGKATDGFGPVGPAVVTGLDYQNLLVQTRLNGEVRQSERSRNMIHSVDKVVSWASRYFTLMPGDMIFTGTPGTTRGMKAGDVVEIEVEGVGVLRNKLVREGTK